MNHSTSIFDRIFLFNSMITPKIITFVYWLMLAGVMAGSITITMTHNIFFGLAVFFAGSIGSRVWCELMIVLFKINENIQRIADKPVHENKTDLII